MVTKVFRKSVFWFIFVVSNWLDDLPKILQMYLRAKIMKQFVSSANIRKTLTPKFC